MRVMYTGAHSRNDYRMAEIFYNEETETELFDRVVKLMEIKGWKIDTSVMEWGGCVLTLPEDYKDFMEDWKESKRCIKNCMKFGF